MLLSFTGCTAGAADVSPENDTREETELSVQQTEPESDAADPEGEQDNGIVSRVQTGMIPEQILEGETGTIHYSYYLPGDYDPQKAYPLMVVMPGYDMMWFGEDSSGANLEWNGFLCWTQLPEEMWYLRKIRCWIGSYLM